MTKGQKVALVTFGVFMAEAILHYNYGKNGHKPKDQKQFSMPTGKDLFKLTVTVAAFSMLNGMIVNNITKS